jgi:capsular polysaccharide biosynthesis protein
MSLQVIKHTGQNLKELKEIKSSKIDGIIINKINDNIYHTVCDIFQYLILFCENGDKLDCPIYLINKENYQLANFYNFFTKNRVFQLSKAPIVHTTGKTVILESFSTPPSAKYFPIIKNHFRKNTTPPINPADKVLIIQRRSYRIINNLEAIINTAREVLNIEPIIYYPEDNTPEQQIETFKTVKLLICAHGAAIASSLLCKIILMLLSLCHQCIKIRLMLNI